MACFEGARLDRCGELGALCRENRSDLSERHRAVANRAAHEPAAFRGELCDIVLQVNVTDAVCSPARKRHRVLAD